MDFSTIKSAKMAWWAAAAALLSLMLAGVRFGVEAQEPRAFVYLYREVFTLPPVMYGPMAAYNLGGLMPEWDETNSTWYVREAGDGDVAARYMIVQRSATLQQLWFVQEGDPVSFLNLDSGRALSWREEGEGEFFLVEEEVGSDGNISAIFQFSASKTQDIQPCPLTLMCRLYNVLDYSSSESDDITGLAPYEEDGVTYFTRASSNLTNLPLSVPVYTHLTSSSSTTTVFGQPFSHVRPQSKLN